MRIISVIVILMLGVFSGAEFKIGLPEAQAQFVATSNRHSTGDAKQSAQINKLSSENQKRLNENQAQDASITTNVTAISAVSATTNDIATCGDVGRLYGPSHAQAPGNCISSLTIDTDGAISVAADMELAGGIKVGSATTCDAAAEGTLRYNSAGKVFEFCDGSAWQGLTAAGSGGGCDYNFTEVTGATIDNYYSSNQPSINGFSGSQSAKLSGDSTATIIKNGVNTGLQSTTVQNFDNIGIRVKSSSNYSRAINTALKIGENYLTCWSVRTKDQDVIPDAFAYSNLSNQDLGTFVSSNVATITGFDGPISVALSGQGSPKVQVNGGSWATTADIQPGDRVQLGLTSANDYEITYAVNYTIGGESGSWTVKTRPDVLELTINSNINNYNIYNAATTAGWTSGQPIKVVVNSGITVGSTSISNPAMTTTGLPASTAVVIDNRGSIIGKGGNAGTGACCYPSDLVGHAGQAGGAALEVTAATSIDNTGKIWGGGGGGGGGGYHLSYGNGGSGGGGAGASPGTGCNPGTLSAGGSGCSPSGGRGGGPGEAGSNGAAGIGNVRYPGGPGGAAGAAIKGNNNVTWLATGDVRGPLQ